MTVEQFFYEHPRQQHHSKQKDKKKIVAERSSFLLDSVYPTEYFDFIATCMPTASNIPSTGLKPGWITTLLLFSLLYYVAQAAEANHQHKPHVIVDLPGPDDMGAYAINQNNFRSTDSKLHTEITLASTLQKRVIACKTAHTYYKPQKSIFRKDKARLAAVIEKLAEDRQIDCKLQTFLKDAQFKFKLCSYKEINAQAKFDEATRSIMVAYECLHSDFLYSVVRHEMQHANVYFQNLNNGRRLIYQDTDKPTPSTIPCKFFSDNQKITSCDEIDKIHKDGIDKAKRLLQTLDNPGSSASCSAEIVEYKNLASDYKPLIPEAEVSEDEVESLKREGILDSRLRFTDPKALADKSAGFEAPAVGFTSHRGMYFCQIKTCDEDNDPRAALRDLILFYEKAKKTYTDPVTRTLELDATFHQVLEGYPKLFNFIFEGLEDYHLNRSDNNYRECVKL